MIILITNEDGETRIQLDQADRDEINKLNTELDERVEETNKKITELVEHWESEASDINYEVRECDNVRRSVEEKTDNVTGALNSLFDDEDGLREWLDANEIPSNEENLKAFRIAITNLTEETSHSYDGIEEISEDAECDELPNDGEGYKGTIDKMVPVKFNTEPTLIHLLTIGEENPRMSGVFSGYIAEHKDIFIHTVTKEFFDSWGGYKEPISVDNHVEVADEDECPSISIPELFRKLHKTEKELEETYGKLHKLESNLKSFMGSVGE